MIYYVLIYIQAIALLCRYSDDKKTAVSIENAHALGTVGIPTALAAALIKHANEPRLLTMACDAVRGLCILPGNRDRLGTAGVCEPIARALGVKRFVDMPDVVCWICRALGHLANGNDGNRLRIGSTGACETAIGAIQVRVYDVNV